MARKFLNEEKAKIWAKLFKKALGLKAKIEIIKGREEFFEVKILKAGKLIPESKEKEALLNDNFDTIRIILMSETALSRFPYTNLSQEMLELIFIESILHELLHVKYPSDNEDEIRDKSALLIGKMREKLLS